MRLNILGMALIGLAGCTGSGQDGRYTGVTTTSQGLCGVGYDSQGRGNATLLLRDGQARFVPDDGVTILDGTVNAAGHVHAATVGEGADHKPFAQVFEGDVADGRVTGQFGSPRCRATVALTRQ